MRYLLVLLAGILIGAFGYHQIRIVRTPSVSTAPMNTRSAGVDDKTPGSASQTTTQATQTPVSSAATAHNSDAIEVPEAASAALINAGEKQTDINASGLFIPVQGINAAQLTDTFTDARSQGRSHDAIDIMAKAGTPVLAVADGTVEKLFNSERGGLTIYQFEPTGKYAYYYAHLQQYAPGLTQGQRLTKGQVIGYVGSTGNASPDAPHLHFAIFVLGPERRWWEGTAINPYPMLGGKNS